MERITRFRIGIVLLLLLLEELLEELLDELLLLPEELPPFNLLLMAASVFSPATPSAESPFAFWKL